MLMTMPQESKAWIAGVVVGPLVGLALGVVLVWFVLSKRTEKKTESNPPGSNQPNAGYVEGNGRSDLARGQHATEGKYYRTYVQPTVYHELGSERPHEMDSLRRHELESVGKSSAEPAELWHGNYGKSRTDISETSNWI
jgi:hypothetical protein